jgi:GDPmannose 4,6-dehydratase
MWLMLQAAEPDDYIVATGESHSVREFCELAFSYADIPLTWCGTGVAEKGLDPNGRVLIAIDPCYFRPTEVDTLLGDASKAKGKLGWRPKVDFKRLIQLMVESDLTLAAAESRNIART